MIKGKRNLRNVYAFICEILQLIQQEFDKPKLPDMTPRTPLLMNHHDEMCERLHHLKSVDGLDPTRAELEMMGFLPLANLCHMRKPSEKAVMERAARLQELVHFVATGGLTQAGMSSLKKKHVAD